MSYLIYTKRFIIRSKISKSNNNNYISTYYTCLIIHYNIIVFIILHDLFIIITV